MHIQSNYWLLNRSLLQNIWQETANPTGFYLLHTVRPPLSGNVGTGTYPEKRFVRLWELRLNTASSIGFIHVIMYSASQKKGSPSIKLIFLKTVMIYQKKFTLLENSIYLLSFDTSYKMYWPCMAKHEPFKIVMSKLICAE